MAHVPRPHACLLAHPARPRDAGGGDDLRRHRACAAAAPAPDRRDRLMTASPSTRPLLQAGGEVTRFVPPLHSPLKGRSNLRDHRKMLIADASLPERRRLWCGGRNLASEYFEGEHGREAWRDLSF